ncbi:MAG: hypothetical protein AAFW84_33900 [Cyanobacteria bacterium J06635_15]
MDKIQAQATKLWDLIFAAETAKTYQKVLALTWTILLESGRLIWLVFCLVLILAAWIGSYATATGRNVRAWYQQLGQQSEAESSSEMFVSAGKSLLDVTSSSAAFLLNQAKDQLGIELPPPPIKVIAPEKPAPAAKTPQPVAPVASVPKVEAKGTETPTPETDESA